METTEIKQAEKFDITKDAILIEENDNLLIIMDYICPVNKERIPVFKGYTSLSKEKYTLQKYFNDMACFTFYFSKGLFYEGIESGDKRFSNITSELGISIGMVKYNLNFHTISNKENDFCRVEVSHSDSEFLIKIEPTLYGAEQEQLDRLYFKQEKIKELFEFIEEQIFVKI